MLGMGGGGGVVKQGQEVCAYVQGFRGWYAHIPRLRLRLLRWVCAHIEVCASTKTGSKPPEKVFQ